MTAMAIEPQLCSPSQKETILKFADAAAEESSPGIRMAALGVKYHFDSGEDYYRELKECLRRPFRKCILTT